MWMWFFSLNIFYCTVLILPETAMRWSEVNEEALWHSFRLLLTFWGYVRRRTSCLVDCGSLNHGKQKPWLGEVGRRAATVKWLMCLSPSLRCEFLSWKAHVLVISDSLMPATVPVSSQEEGSFWTAFKVRHQEKQKHRILVWLRKQCSPRFECQL